MARPEGRQFKEESASPSPARRGGDTLEADARGRREAPRHNVYEVENIDTATADHGEPFDTLFDPALQADALTYEAAVQRGAKTKPAASRV